MSATHTAGPWAVHSGPLRAQLSQKVKFIAVRSADGVNIVSWPGFDDGSQTYEVMLANARLIAAAPVLLAALKAVEDFIGGVPDAIEPFGLVRDAIAAATGATT